MGTSRLRVEARGLIYDASGKPDTEKVAIFTSLCPCADGSLLSCFQVASAKRAPDARLQLCRSVDGGNTWAEQSWRFATTVTGIPVSLAAGEVVEVQPGRLLLLATWFDRSEPKRPLFDPASEGVLHSKILKSFSTDGGQTWSAWEEVDVGGLRGCAGTGPIVKWPDGARS
ncbi:MAG: glycoside hydrolase [Verrucomicrobiae bacterium]|nr:glycoside hydrolase [Verrucomicrobiae bacterium]